MTASVSDSHYKDHSAVTVESEALRAIFLPALGGKLASLVHKGSGIDFLLQAKNPNYKSLAYDGVYVDAECSGFDDMFPTIDRSFCESFPWSGTAMPDHGEVCALRWDLMKRKTEIRMSVRGVRFAYRLDKRIRFTDANTLRIEYSLVNLCDYPFEYIYAAHVMLAVEEGGEIFTPFEGGTTGTYVFGGDRRLGDYGDRVAWPRATMKDGSVKNMSVTPPISETGDSYKLYFVKNIPRGVFGYRYPTTGLSLVLHFSLSQLPYIGLWINEGSFHGHGNIALEPCSAAFDRPDLARIHGTSSVLGPRAIKEWSIEFFVDATAYRSEGNTL